MRRIIPLLLLALALAAGCTRPPYAKPGAELTAVENDYTDCYSKASLDVNTPPFPDRPLTVVDQDADACMKERGYVPKIRLN